jgi:glutamine cyclotransferase
MHTLLALALACSDYDLKRGSDAEGVDTDQAAPQDTAPPDEDAAIPGLSVEVFDPVSTCYGPGEGALVITNDGDADLEVQGVLVVSVSDGTLSTEADLPAVLTPGDALTVVLTWVPSAADTLEAELELYTDHPDQPTMPLEVSGEVAFESTPPVVTLSSAECTTLLPGVPVTLRATVSDAEDPADALYYYWEDETGAVLDEGYLDPSGVTEITITPDAGAHDYRLRAVDTCNTEGENTYELTVIDSYYTYPGSEPDGLGFDDLGYLWIADYGSDRVYQVVPDTLGVLQEFTLPYNGADGLTWMNGEMLVSFYSSNVIAFIDPCTSTVVDVWSAPGSGVSDVSWDGSELWAVDYTAAYLYRLDPSTGVTQEVVSAPFSRPNGLAWDGTSFWMTANYPGQEALARLDTDFKVVEEYEHYGDPRGVAWDGSQIWFSDASLWFIGTITP